jgi:hypothetical protein
MNKSISAKQKIRGRPATGQTPMMGFRATDQLRGAIVKWAEKQPDMPKLSEAVRRLVEIGLAKDGKTARKPVRKGSTRAAELAGEVIDSRMAADATSDERETRKRRLVKGPSSFRDVRKDHPK